MAPGPTIPDWLTYGYDQQRGSWNRGETSLSKNTVGGMTLLWSQKVTDNTPALVLSTLTAPLVVAGVATPKGQKDLLLTITMDDTLVALDAASGQTVWRVHFDNPEKPLRPVTIACSNSEQATPVIDKQKGVVYFTTSDGKLRAAALADGSARMRPTRMIQPFSRNWSLNLVDDVVYTTTGRGCGGSAEQPIENGTVAAMDVSDPDHPALSRFYTGKGRPAGPWGATGVAWGPQGAYVSTADGPNDPGSGIYGDMVLAVQPHAWGLNDSFLPAHWRYIYSKDLDFGSGGPILFAYGKRNVVATASKEGVIYLLDADRLGGADHSTALYQSPRLGNDIQDFQSQGVWGSMATWQDADGARWLYVPMWGPPAKMGPAFAHPHGAVTNGSIMAFRLTGADNEPGLDPQWISRDLNMASPPVVANGVVYALQTAESTVQVPGPPQSHVRPPGWTQEKSAEDRIITPHAVMTLFAFDAQTGQQLWSSGKAMDGNAVHFTQPVVALGRVFAVDHAGHVYAFGLKK
ncbi:MAG: PQQ-binding-like beta-propeller repeat protein [Alphaproteobacteria bacterium]|nr:PQQ-binding-like beta-propeller repeat protein [Alphaproteobacteria bacterium]